MEQCECSPEYWCCKREWLWEATSLGQLLFAHCTSQSFPSRTNPYWNYISILGKHSALELFQTVHIRHKTVSYIHTRDCRTVLTWVAPMAWLHWEEDKLPRTLKFLNRSKKPATAALRASSCLRVREEREAQGKKEARSSEEHTRSTQQWKRVHK